MTTALRQRALFDAEDWRIVYQAFTNANYTAYDFQTIRDSMVDYIRINFPEDFNDWIESSEFVAIIELLAYLGQSLSFRLDLNTRENFLDTAERRDSILRLARMLSYVPSRNLAAQGLVKLTQISSNQTIFDSNGQNLANQTILWNDPTNPDWFEQFILVLNSALSPNNQFGDPVNSGLVSRINTQTYMFNNVSRYNNCFPFSAIINNQSLNFEVVNADFKANETFYEKSPNPATPFNIIYRNDGRGNSSPDTGFFFYFKQGTLINEDYNITNPIENRVITLKNTNINNDDLWLQEIDSTGQLVEEWTKVPALVGNNVIFNAIDKNIRKIFNVNTLENDGAAIRFADGRFGQIPIGLFRTWYRQSSNTRYTIRPDDMKNVKFNFSYYSGPGNKTYNISFKCELQRSIGNSYPSETSTRIQTVAPQVFYTQDRMINGEDYSIYPLKDPRIAKIKSVNRIHSGFSRYVDINDPTGNSQNLSLLGQDGMIYLNTDTNLVEIDYPTTLSGTQIVSTYFAPQLKNYAINQFFYFNYPSIPYDLAHGATYPYLRWSSASNATNTGTGFFTYNTHPVPIGSSVTGSVEFHIDSGSLVLFRDAGWVGVKKVINSGTIGSSNGDGAVTLSEIVFDNDEVLTIIPPYPNSFSQNETTQIANFINLKTAFGLRYDTSDRNWKIITGNNINENADFSLDFAGDNSGLKKDASWIIRVEFNQNNWSVYTRTMEYIFESDNEIKFYYSNTDSIIDLNTGRKVSDFFKVLKVNSNVDVQTGSDGISIVENSTLGKDHDIYVSSVFLEDDGFVDPKRLKVTFSDNDYDGLPDDPYVYTDITGLDYGILYTSLKDIAIDSSELFFKTIYDINGYPVRSSTTAVKAAFNQLDDMSKANVEALIRSLGGSFTNFTLSDGDVIYIRSQENFYQYSATTEQFTLTTSYEYRRGRKDLMFVWKHFAPLDNRIDPSPTNIIDNYVLTVEYDYSIRSWIDTGGAIADTPEPPSSEDLKIMFSDIETKKSISDQIVWQPVYYKILFGAQAPEELRASFKVTKIPGVSLSDGEIKAKIINAINAFFSLNNWDFGETFYFTEMSAYVHQQLATIISSFVIVPLNEESKFGQLFQVRSASNEVFISAAQVSDIQIVESLNSNTLRIGK